jgi:hypothetical protein
MTQELVRYAMLASASATVAGAVFEGCGGGLQAHG